MVENNLAELQRVVAGLVSIAKDLTTNVTQVTQTVSNMAQTVPAAPNPDNTQGLPMSSIQLHCSINLGKTLFQITHQRKPAQT